MAKKILITGASSGFGQLAVDALLAEGHTIVASIRDPEGRNSDIAQSLRSKGVHVVEIDVTNEDSVNLGVASAIEAADGLDVLINNAGVGVMGMTENFTTDDMQKLFEINLFGVQRMTRAVLKHFHEKKSGYVLNVSSILGRMTIPFYGPYNASKWALEALTENYRTELSQFGIDFGLVEPGGFPTSFMDRLIRPSDNSRDELYGDFIHAPQQSQEGFEQALAENPAQDPKLVSEAIVSLINTPAGERPFRTVVDKMGMGDHIEGYNEHLEKLTQGIYTAFGTDGLLNLNTGHNQ
ncbi:SDR family oxidoreductase [Aliikangiella marina]|uniref:SDR family oxidoreductase n=1 Tax=Aliikangiella marina TaxID=1712262 RepID=A0A545TC41_9GAMM|nr:SDR family oxidoreductase [Aliikangiella marina]TQV74793.1 SDR family oxidoreductase [Aliikangiella marina]